MPETDGWRKNSSFDGSEACSSSEEMQVGTALAHDQGFRDMVLQQRIP